MSDQSTSYKATVRMKVEAADEKTAKRYLAAGLGMLRATALTFGLPITLDLEDVPEETHDLERLPDLERLAAFVFRLARDDVSFGRMEDHLRVVEKHHPDGAPAAEYLDGAKPLGEWARSVSARLVTAS